MIADQKKCINCGKPFRGRLDKKYCSGNCRNRYNSRRSNLAKAAVRFINFRLRRNRRILERSFQNARNKIAPTKNRFSANGFQFQYFTHHETDPDGNQFVFCYEYGYRLLADDSIMIIKRINDFEN